MENKITVFWEFVLASLAAFAAGIIWWILKEGKSKYDDCQRRLEEKDAEIRRLNEQQAAVAQALMLSAGLRAPDGAPNLMLATEYVTAKMNAEDKHGHDES